MVLHPVATAIDSWTSRGGRARGVLSRSYTEHARPTRGRRIRVDMLCSRRRPYKPTRHNARSFFLGTNSGLATLLFLGMSFLICLGTVAWMSAGDCGGEATSLEEDCIALGNHDSFYQSTFFSWGLFFDPGTQTGLPPNAPYGAKFTVLLFSVAGFIFNLVVLGIIVELLRMLMDRWKRLHHRVIANDHTIILGWTDKTLFLIEEQARLLTGSKQRGGTICVLGEMATRDMKEEVSVTFPDWPALFPGVRLVYRQGKPYEVQPPFPEASAMRLPHVPPPRLVRTRRDRCSLRRRLTTSCAFRCARRAA